MQYKDLKNKNLPDSPGVYIFKDVNKKILYIGKATVLRDRVRSYFNKDILRSRGHLIQQMVELARDVDYRQTDSVLEAIILETHLIKKHQPKYNSKEKDDKSFNYLIITKENFPRIIVSRGRELFQKFSKEEIRYLFGPFPQGSRFKEAMRIIRKIFPFRDRCKPSTDKSNKPCFNRQINLCPGVCTGEVSKAEYARLIRHLKLFLDGRKPMLLKTLAREMKEYARKQEFEKAVKIKKRIFALTHIQDVALIGRESFKIQSRKKFRIEAYDVAHLGGMNAVGVMVVVEDGQVKKTDYRKFRIRGVKGVDDTASLKEILERRLTHKDWTLPALIVVDGGVAQKNIAERVLEKFRLFIPVAGVVKNERHKPKRIVGAQDLQKIVSTPDVDAIENVKKLILLANSEAHRFAIAYHKKLRASGI